MSSFSKSKRKVIKKRNRTGSEQCPICLQNEILVEHHIHGRNIQNYNASWNLCYICDNCHRKIHSGKIVLEDWAMTNEGMVLLWHFSGEKGLTGNDADVHTY